MIASGERPSDERTKPEKSFPFLYLATRDDNKSESNPPFHSISVPNLDADPQNIAIALQQRVRELNCLYGICHLMRKHGNSIYRLLQDITNFLPSGWQYPKITCARIVFHGKTFVTQNFKITQWRQSHAISIYDKNVGEVTVCYLEERPPADEGPFLAEQRALLAAVAEQISHTVRRIAANIELKEIGWRLTVQEQALEEANAALRMLAAEVEKEKEEICRNTQENFERVFAPIINTLTAQVSRPQEKELNFLKSQLKEATSPFTRRLTEQCYSLTPSEVAICNFIRSGLKTKEIAEIRSVSVATVNRHREHIRRKLGIANSDVNLATYLQSAMWEQN
jgi:DNA-binding NarL/FixJ family response regulator